MTLFLYVNSKGICWCLKFVLLFYSSARYNNIGEIDQDAFEDLYRLLDIFLDYNEITRIEARTFKGLVSIEIL